MVAFCVFVTYGIAYKQGYMAGLHEGNRDKGET
jgi:hypothetical protein